MTLMLILMLAVSVLASAFGVFGVWWVAFFTSVVYAAVSSCEMERLWGSLYGTDYGIIAYQGPITLTYD